MSKRFVNPALFGLLCPVLLMWQLTVPAPAQTQPQVDLSGKSVLVMHAWEANLPMSTETNKALSRVFSSGGIPAFNQSFECLDLRRNPVPEYKKLLAEKMRLQYRHRKPDLIIAVNPIAMRFATDDCRDVFADIPILALMLPTGFQVPKTSRRVISHFPSLDIVRTLDIALKLVPHVKRVYVASGSYETDIAFENQVRRVSKKWEGRLQFLYLSSMPFEDMLAAVSKAPSDSIVLTLGFARDVSGKLLTTPTAIRGLSQASAAPVFGIADVALGYGIAGGFLSSYEFIGTKAGELALDILRGVKTPDSIPDVLDVPAVPMFDWRQLRRWKLSEAALPKGSIIINKETTLWDFRYYIIGALVFCLAETALIIILIAQRRRKKSAEEGLLRKTEELDQFFNVTIDPLCIANTDGYLLRLNPAWERILGYTREELMAKPFLEFVHSDDLGRTREAVSTLTFQQELLSFENRYRCKDGTYRWLEWSSVPAGNLIYAAARDVTERKRVEQALHKSQEKAQRVAVEALAVAEVGRIISSTLTVEEVYEPFAAVVKRIIPFDRIVISTVDSEKGTFKNAYMAGAEIGDREAGEVHTLEGSGMAEMLRTKSPFLLQAEDLTDYQDRLPMLLSTFQAGFRSILNVPLISKGEVIGGLLLRSFTPHAYTDEHVRLAERIGNQISGAIANAQLFLKQKQAEEGLRESEDRFRQVAESVGDFIWEVDANGLYRYTSPSVERILGYKPDELIGKKHFYDLFAQEVREELKAVALTAIAGKQPFRALPNPNVSKEGREVQLETSGMPILDDGGNLVGYRGADTDVTERRKFEKALAESQAQIAAVMNSTKDFIWSVDPERFGVLTWNRAFGDYFLERRGIELKVGMTPAELVPPDYVPFWHDVFSRALREEFVVAEYVVVAQNMTLLLSLHAMRRNGKTFGISVFGKDITERKLAEKAIEDRLQFERLVSVLSARFVNIPHDRVDSEIEHGLRRILEFFHVDRCGLVHVLRGGTTFRNTHIAIADDVAPVPTGVDLPISLRPWAYEKLIRNNQVVSFSRIDDLPAEASLDRQGYIEWGIRSNLNIPIVTGEAVENIIIVQSVKSERAWPEEYVPRLRLLGEIFVNALERKQIRLQIEERFRFEGLMSDLSAGFVNLPPDEVDSEINKGLRSITEFFDADRCSIGLFSEDRTQLALAFEYRRVEAEPAPGSLSKQQMPWYIKQLIEGKPVVINRVADFPPEAEDERQFCLAKGMKSLLSIPMVSGGKTLGSCALVLTRGERVWPEELGKRFQLLTEVFANALQGKLADTLLRTSEEKFRQFFAHVPEFCYIVSPDGIILDVNDWALQGLGYGKEDLVGKPLAKIYAPESISKIKNLFARWKEKGEIRNEEMVVITKKGEKRTVLLNVGAVRDKDGAILHSTSIQTDITERKQADVDVQRAREQLLHVERSARMGELTASLAHELNQPLAAILSNAQAALRFLQSDKVNLDEFREILHDIIQDDQRAGNVIRSLRSMMKREERERNPIILNNVVNEVIQIFHTESIFRNVQVDTAFDESLLPVLGDKVQLQQVVLNLIVNAADAMSRNPPEQRKIFLGTQVKDDRIRVTIRDSGPGIDQGNMERIFQPFFTTKGAGLGMGLAVSQTIVEAHGGHIWAENNPDGGATFFVELPVISD